MASFSSTYMEDNLRTEIAMSIGKATRVAIRSPLEEIRIAMGKMVQALCLLHVANEIRRQGDESNVEEGCRRPQDKRRKVVKYACREDAILHDLELEKNHFKQKEQSSCLEAVHLEENKSGSMENQSQVCVPRTYKDDCKHNFEDYSDFLEPDSPLDALQSKQPKQASLSAMPGNNLDYTGTSFERETTLQTTQHIYESKDGHCHSISMISDNACSNLSKDMDDKSLLHPNSHVDESTLTDFTLVYSSSSTKKFHTDVVDRGSNFSIEGQVTLASKEGLDETGFSRYLCQPNSIEQIIGVVTDQGVSQLQSKGKRNIITLNKKHNESLNGRSFLETSGACTALLHGIAFEDKNLSHGLPLDKIDNPPELVGDLFQTSINTGPRGAIRLAQGIQVVMAIGNEWLLEVSITANTSRDAFSALQLGLLNPVYLRQVLERMGATDIKMGQFLASTSNLFPTDYVTKFQNDFDKAPAVPFQEIEAIIWDELMQPLENVYEYIDPVPIASASITQVHGARLKGSQQEVVFKVLKPGIEDFFIADLNFLYEVARIVEFLNPQISHTSLVGIVGDIRQAMREEVDFQKEVANIDSFRKYLGTMGLTRQATTPKVYSRCSTGRVLTMERLYGVPLTNLDSIRSPVCSPEARNTWLLHDGWIGFLNFGIVGRISPNSRLKIMLDDEDVPHKWYNLIADLPEPPPPTLNPETQEMLEVDKRFRENRLEKMLGTLSRIYYNEGVKSLVTETGVEQWGSALAFAFSLFDLQCEVWKVRASYDQKPCRKMMIGNMWSKSPSVFI
eukprot:Gb_30919 [translate_table: standard]